MKRSKRDSEDERQTFAKNIYIYRSKNEENAQDLIKKQALLEALFQTEIWNEPYVRHNPFLYITPRTSDFEGETG